MELKTDELKRFAQVDNLAGLIARPAMSEMLTVSLKDKTDKHTHYIDCGLIPSAKVEECLSRATYDLTPGGGAPGANRYHEKDGSTHVEYLRFGNDEGFEPLVIERSFHGLRPEYVEISEEFRLFHNLYHDQKTNQFYKTDDAGNEELVAVIALNAVRIRLREIRQFLAIKEMHLSIQFDFRENSPEKLEDLGLTATNPTDQREGLTFWGLNYGDVGMSGCRAFSRLLGKTMITPVAREKSGFWGYAADEPEQYADFIIGETDEGDKIFCTGEPAAMGRHPNRPDYLTRVDFNKTVLDKYYQQSSKYSVEDGFLRCGGLWGTYIDNDQPDKVSVWLGDLGRDLPYSEQLHFKAHNIPPKRGSSSTFFRRQIMAEFADAQRIDHLFQQGYQSLAKTSTSKLGWNFLAELADEDVHHLRSMRIPATDEQKDFDDLVLSLTRILIDYLNEKELKGLSKPGGVDLPSGISLLEKVFKDHQLDDAQEHITFLRDLQRLRSKGSAHRKGTEYRKLISAHGGEHAGLQTIFEGLLRKATAYLIFLNDAIEQGRFESQDAPHGASV